MIYLFFLLFAPPMLSDTPLNGIRAMHHIKDDVHLILHERQGFQVSVYDAKKDSLLLQGIPSGQGPGESQGVTSFTIDPESGNFYFADVTGFLFITDKNLTVLRQHQIGRHSLHSLAIVNSKIYLGIKTYTPLDPKGEVKVGVILDKQTLAIQQDISIPVEALGFADVPNVDRQGISFMIRPNFMNIGGNPWLMIEQFPFAFRLDTRNRIAETRRFSDQQTVEVMQRFGQWGLRLAAICLSFQFEDGHLFCWNGNTNQNIPLGLYVLNMNDSRQAPIQLRVETDAVIDGMVMASMGASTLITTEIMNMFTPGAFLYRFENPRFVEQ